MDEFDFRRYQAGNSSARHHLRLHSDGGTSCGLKACLSARLGLSFPSRDATVAGLRIQAKPAPA
jgi:hypothetical protein